MNQYIWNDVAILFIGKRPFRKGDIIPANMMHESLIKQYLRYGKMISTPIVKEPEKPVNPIKLSISVMAHPSREKYFPYIRKKLGDVPFSIDQKNNLLENCKAAWRLYDPSADFHCVIQDDAIICDNFRDRAERFINEHEEKRINSRGPIQGYNFYLKKDKDNLNIYEGCFIDRVTKGGVAVCLPVKIIKPMLDYFDKQNSRHDDDRISEFIRKNGYRIVFPLPSLVDHRTEEENKSLSGIHKTRTAWKYIDNMQVTIPKIIHHLWVGPKPRPKKWMDSWKEKNPGWEYRLWDEKEIKNTKWVNQKHIDYYWKRGIWHGVSDVCTYEILFNHGGFMPGADSICQLPIDDLFLCDYDSYSCYENEKIRPGLISPLMASVKNGKFAEELIEGLSKINSVGEPWKTTGNLYMGNMYKKTKHNVKIFPSHYFNPKHFTGEEYNGPGPIYSRQMWGTTISGYDQGVDDNLKLVTLSISVMAHPRRAEFFQYLKDRLGDVPFSIDQKNNLLENSKAAWRLYDPDCDFHVVIQDDCIVCDNFKERAIQFLSEQEAKRISECRRPQGYNFFLKNADDGSKITISGDCYIDKWTRAGLAICLPTKMIEPMIIEFDKQKSRHDDDRISGFMQKNEYRIVFPFPSLIDHRIELDSLAGNVVGLKAIKFIDEVK